MLIKIFFIDINQSYFF